MSGEDRRQDDGLILKMHGNIETLLERTKNTNGRIEEMAQIQKDQDKKFNEKFDDQEKDISDNDGEIKAIKRVTGFVAVIFLGITAYFGYRK